MEVRDARHEMVQRFDLSKSQAAMTVLSSDAVYSHTTHTSRTTTTSGEVTVGSADSTQTTVLTWSVQARSRTAQLLQDTAVTPGTCTSENAGTHIASSHLLLELYRADLFTALFQMVFPQLVRVFHCEGLLTQAEQKELPARWVLQGLNELPSILPEVRTRVTLLDKGATVRMIAPHSSSSSASPSSMPTDAHTARADSRKRPRDSVTPTSTVSLPSRAHNQDDPVDDVLDAQAHTPQTLYEVLQTSSMSHGQYWVEVRAVNPPDTSAAVKVDCSALGLSPPKRLYVDALLPCDEACSVRGTSTCLFLSLLLGAARVRAARGPDSAWSTAPQTVSRSPDVAGLTVAMSQVIGLARHRLWDARRHLIKATGQQSAHCIEETNTADETPLQRPLLSYSSASSSCDASFPEITDAINFSTAPQRTLEVWLENGDAIRLVLLPPGPSSEAASTDGSFEGARAITLLVRTVQKLARGYDRIRTSQLGSTDTAHRLSTWLEAAIKSHTSSASSSEAESNAHTDDAGHDCGGADLGASAGCRRAEVFSGTRSFRLCSTAVGVRPHDEAADASSAVTTSHARATHKDHTTSEAVLSLFFIRLFTMAYRYRTLQGDEGYNGGPHAAILPAVLESLREVFSITMEAFASPLNHHFPLFGSLFPDTDAVFGSVGSFFDLDVRSGHVEVNPPFDTAVLERTQRTLFACLDKSESAASALGELDHAASPTKHTEVSSEKTQLDAEQNAPHRSRSLLFVVVLPSHDLDPWEHSDGAEESLSGRTAHTDTNPPTKTKVSADRVMRESPYCLAHALCRAEESAYVDGQQHLLRAPLFCIRSPTRLIVLGNKAARLRYPDVAARLETVRRGWCQMTRDALREE